MQNIKIKEYSKYIYDKFDYYKKLGIETTQQL